MEEDVIIIDHWWHDQEGIMIISDEEDKGWMLSHEKIMMKHLRKSMFWVVIVNLNDSDLKLEASVELKPLSRIEAKPKIALGMQRLVSQNHPYTSSDCCQLSVHTVKKQYYEQNPIAFCVHFMVVDWQWSIIKVGTLFLQITLTLFTLMASALASPIILPSIIGGNPNGAFKVTDGFQGIFNKSAFHQIGRFKPHPGKLASSNLGEFPSFRRGFRFMFRGCRNIYRFNDVFFC